MPAGDGVWRVWKVLEGLEGLEGFGSSALKAHRKPLLWPWPWVPVGEVALALGCLLDKVFGGFGRFWRAPGGFWRVLEGFGGFGGFWRVVRQDKFHTCGGPRRRPGLGEGRGRRILA